MVLRWNGTETALKRKSSASQHTEPGHRPERQQPPVTRIGRSGALSEPGASAAVAGQGLLDAPAWGRDARADRRWAGAWQACWQAYLHCATGRTWAMAWAGTVMTPLAVRTLTALAGPLTSEPHHARPLVAVTATAVVV